MKRINESQIPLEFNNYRLDKYLSQRFDYLSRTTWQKEIKSGKIKINNVISKNIHKKIKSEDIILYEGKNIKEPEVDSNFTTLYEDDYLLAINKSGNLPIHPAGIFFNNTLQMILEKQIQKKIYPIHRIDRETSGIILIAKNSKIASQIQSNFSSAEKSYLAIVHGNVKENFFSNKTPIGNDKNSLVRKKRDAYSNAPELAITHFKKICNTNNYSIVKATLETGRQHQIRIHLNNLGYPIVGDKLYGKDEKFYLEFIENGLTPELLKKLEFNRSALHSRSLNFFHPVFKKFLYIKAPLPKDMKDFIKFYL